MKKLSKIQTLILSCASKQDDRIALPLPAHLRGAVAKTVVGMLIERGMLDEIDADLCKGEPMWRETGDGHGTTLVITDLGLAAIGVEVAPAVAARDADQIAEADKKVPRAGSKLAILVDMLAADNGATLAAIVAATEWQPHTARGAMTNLTKRYPHLGVTSAKPEGAPERIYRLAK